MPLKHTKYINCISWNVNSIVKRLECIYDIVMQYQPDVICLQETRSIHDWVYIWKMFRSLKYHVLLTPSYKGRRGLLTGILLQDKDVISPVKYNDSPYPERYREDIWHLESGQNIHILNVYIHQGALYHNGKSITDVNDNVFKQHGCDYIHKLYFLKWIIVRIIRLRLNKSLIILAGDFNVVTQLVDSWHFQRDRKIITDHVTFSIPERKLMLILTSILRDAGQYQPPQELYTWYNYRYQTHKENRKDVGLRIDYIFSNLNLNTYKRLINYRFPVDINRSVSDHVPILARYVV